MLVLDRGKASGAKMMSGNFLHAKLSWNQSWSSLGERDEQLDRPSSQTTMELCLARVA